LWQISGSGGLRVRLGAVAGAKLGINSEQRERRLSPLTRKLPLHITDIDSIFLKA
jgi:hypothetical protein